MKASFLIVVSRFSSASNFTDHLNNKPDIGVALTELS